VSAQDQPAANQGEAVLDEIIVTAQRRAESIQDVPIAVSAFTEAQLESRQVTSTLDLIRVVPNLTGHNNTGTATANTYFMRGLGSTEQIALLDPAVSTYVDEVILPRQNVNNYALFDVERIEVLRGPQGTTFGRNSTGGAISVITRKPGEELGGYLTAGGGSFGRILVRGSVDVPFSEKVLSKFSAYYVEEDGWLENISNGQDLNGTDSWGLRAALRFLLADAVTWDVAAEYMVADGVYLRSIVPSRDRTRTVFTTSGATDDTLADMLANRGLRNDTDSVGLISNFQWEVGGVTANAITGLRRVNQDFVLDFSLPTAAANPAPFALNNEGRYDAFSQEFKFTGGGDGRLSYVAGLYFFYEDNITKAGQAFGGVLSCSSGLFGDGRTTCLTLAGPMAGYSSFRDIRNETTSYAAYAQVDYSLTDRVTLVAGARYTDEKKEVDLIATPQGGMTTADLRSAGVPTELNTDLVTPKLGVNFDASDDVMFFVSATRGFKAGGWNSRTAYLPQQFQVMQPEKTWSYEAGVKSELFERRLRLNVNVFRAETDGLQLSYTTPGPIPGTTLSTQDNAGDLRVDGIELELNARLGEYLELYGSAGYQDGEYTATNRRAGSFCTNGGTVVNGACANPVAPATTTTYINAIDITDVPSRLPEETISLGLSWEVPAPAMGGTFRFAAEGNYNSGYWTTAANATPTLRLIPGGPLVTPVGPATPFDTFAPSYTLVNLTAGYESENGSWKLLVECKNCTDKEYLTSVFNGGFYGEPRRISGAVTFRF
jgi:iron complex outermembrane receptor protein